MTLYVMWKSKSGRPTPFHEIKSKSKRHTICGDKVPKRGALYAKEEGYNFCSKCKAIN